MLNSDETNQNEHWDDALKRVQGMEQQLEKGAASLRQLMEQSELLSTLELRYNKDQGEALEALRQLELEPDPLERYRLEWDTEAAGTTERAKGKAAKLDDFVQQHLPEASDQAPGKPALSALATALIEARYPRAEDRGEDAYALDWVNGADFPRWQMVFFLEAGLVEQNPQDSNLMRLLESLDVVL